MEAGGKQGILYGELWQQCNSLLLQVDGSSGRKIVLLSL